MTQNLNWLPNVSNVDALRALQQPNLLPKGPPAVGGWRTAGGPLGVAISGCQLGAGGRWRRCQHGAGRRGSAQRVVGWGWRGQRVAGRRKGQRVAGRCRKSQQVDGWRGARLGAGWNRWRFQPVAGWRGSQPGGAGWRCSRPGGAGWRRWQSQPGAGWRGSQPGAGWSAGWRRNESGVIQSSENVCGGLT
eukprot:jgi/Psemu1/233049/e_gw1.5955.1.1